MTWSSGHLLVVVRVGKSVLPLFPCVLHWCAREAGFSSFEGPETLVKMFLLLRELHSLPRFALPLSALMPELRGVSQPGGTQKHAGTFTLLCSDCPAYVCENPLEPWPWGS